MRKSIFFIFLLSVLHSSLLVSSVDVFLAPITKDNSTNLYSLSVYLKTPLQVTNLHLDLGGSISWVDCSRRYKSSSYQHLLYNTSLCESLYGKCFKKPAPGCFNDSCDYFCENSVTRNVFIGNILLDSLALSSADGRNPSRLKVIKDFIFACSDTKILRGLPNGATGVAALGRFNYSLPFQLSRAGSSSAVFAVCLPSSAAAGNGVAFFNSLGPYNFLPGIDVSKSLIYTPLLLNPVVGTVIFYTRPSDEYFIGVSSIKINGKSVSLNQTLLKIDMETGYGGTKITNGNVQGGNGEVCGGSGGDEFDGDNSGEAIRGVFSGEGEGEGEGEGDCIHARWTGSAHC
nr:PREDICTED: basic 7S globulin 2-like [Nicotiana tabacum]